MRLLVRLPIIANNFMFSLFIKLIICFYLIINLTFLNINLYLIDTLLFFNSFFFFPLILHFIMTNYLPLNHENHAKFDLMLLNHFVLFNPSSFLIVLLCYLKINHLLMLLDFFFHFGSRFIIL